MESGTPVRKHGRIAVNFSWLMAGEIAAKGFAFISTVYLARVLGTSNYGLYTLATAFLAYGMLLTDFGLSTYGTRTLARENSEIRTCVHNVQSTRLVLAWILFAVGTTISFFVVHNPPVRLLFIFSFVGLVPYALGLDWAFRGLELMGFSTLWNVLQQAVFIALVLFAVKSSDQVVVVPLCKAVGCLVASVYLVLLFKKRIPEVGYAISLRLPTRETILDMLKIGIPLAAAYLMVQVYWNIDTIILGLMDKPEAVGIYNAAYRVVMVATGVCYTITNSFYPGLSYDFCHDIDAYKLKLKRMLQIVIGLGVCAALTSYFLRGMIIAHLYGKAYEAAVPALAILSIAIVGDFIVSAFGTAFVSAGFERTCLIAVALGAISNIGLNVMLIPKLSYIGAGIATVLSYALMMIFYLVNFRRITARGNHGSQ